MSVVTHVRRTVVESACVYRHVRRTFVESDCVCLRMFYVSYGRAADLWVARLWVPVSCQHLKHDT